MKYRWRRRKGVGNGVGKRKNLIRETEGGEKKGASRERSSEIEGKKNFQSGDGFGLVGNAR